MNHIPPSRFAMEVKDELEMARNKHPSACHSLHEGYAVLLEEVLEVQAEVFRKITNLNAVRAELVQVAAMAQRMAEDLGL